MPAVPLALLELYILEEKDVTHGRWTGFWRGGKPSFLGIPLLCCLFRPPTAAFPPGWASKPMPRCWQFLPMNKTQFIGSAT